MYLACKINIFHKVFKLILNFLHFRDDFEKIRKEYADLRESNNIKDAQIESLMSALNRFSPLDYKSN